MTVEEFDGGYALFGVDDEAVAQRVLAKAVAEASVSRFAPVVPSLAQIFREVIK